MSAGIDAGLQSKIGLLGLKAADPRTLASYGQQGLTGAAAALAGAAARSLIDGTDFGDNIAATLPDVIGSTIGNLVAGGIAGKGAPRAGKTPKPGAGNAPANNSDIVVNKSALNRALSAAFAPVELNLPTVASANLISVEGQIALAQFDGTITAAQAQRYRAIALASKQASRTAYLANNPLQASPPSTRIGKDGKPYLQTSIVGPAIDLATIDARQLRYDRTYDAKINSRDGRAEVVAANNYNRKLVNQWDAIARNQIDRDIGGFFLLTGGLGAGFAVPGIAAGIFGLGTRGFYAASIGAGSGLGLVTEYGKNKLLNEKGTVGGYASAVVFGGLGGTGFSLIAPEARYVTSLSRFTGLSTERIASAGNGFVFGGLADGSKQLINLQTGDQLRFNGLSVLQGGAFGSIGGAARSRYYGFGAEDQLNIAVARSIFATTGRAPVGISPLLALKSYGETQLPVTIGQAVITPAVEVGVKKTLQAVGR